MSGTIDQAFIQSFNRKAKEAYQQTTAKMRATTRVEDGVQGSKSTFQKVGKGSATTKARHGVIPPMNLDHTPVSYVLEDFYAGDWVDKLDKLKINIDEQMLVAKAGAYALNRKADDLLIAAAAATTTTVGDYSTGVTRALFLQAVEALNDNDVPDDGDRYGWLTPRQWSIAMTLKEFASADYVGSDLPFAKSGEVRTWLGVHWVKHNRLTGKGTATADNLLWHKTAMGFGNQADVRTDITWHGDRASFFVNHMMAGGACLIDAEGVVKIKLDDTAAIPAS